MGRRRPPTPRREVRRRPRRPRRGAGSFPSNRAPQTPVVASIAQRSSRISCPGCSAGVLPDELPGPPERVGDAGAAVQRPVRSGDHGQRERLGRVDVFGEPGRVDPLHPRGVEQVEQLEARVVHLGGDVVGVVHRARERGTEAVGRPEHAGARVEETTGRRGVEHRRSHHHQLPVADVDRLADVDPAHALQRQLDVAEEPPDHRVVGQQGRVRAEVEHRVEVAEVVVVVVRQEDPADVLGLDDGEDVLQPLVTAEQHAGVDDHRLAAADDRAVGADEAARRVGGQRRDQPGVGGDRFGGGGQQLGLHRGSFARIEILTRIRLY